MSAEKRSGGFIRTVLGIGLVVGIVLGMKTCNMGKDSKEVKAQGARLITQIPGYQENKETYEAYFNKAHKAAFKQSYKMGGRRQGAEFDVNVYAKALFLQMMAQAKTANDRESAIAIQLLAVQKGVFPPEGVGGL